MKKILVPGVLLSAVLLVFAFLCLWMMPMLLPQIAEEYYNPAFVNDPARNAWYYVQPVVLAFGLSWFWSRFKQQLTGNWFFQGLEMGLIYLVIATVPAMILTYSAIDVTLHVIGTWILYGFLQATIAGLICARLHV
ncbi:MAG: hypothetical protein ACK4E8_05505 [Lacibacter sp.]